MVAYFNDKSTRPTRALQAWIILVSRARNRQTLTYTMLDKLLDFGSPHALGQILDYINKYCQVNALPPLTIIVVNKDTGIPSSGIGDFSFSDQEKVFEFNWFGVCPPTPEELDDAHKASVSVN